MHITPQRVALLHLRVRIDLIQRCGKGYFTATGVSAAGRHGLVAWRQVTPLQWPPQRMRHVLNHAFGGYISDEMLDAAAQALDLGFEGSLSRYATGSQKPSVIH